MLVDTPTLEATDIIDRILDETDEAVAEPTTPAPHKVAAPSEELAFSTNLSSSAPAILYYDGDTPVLTKRDKTVTFSSDTTDERRPSPSLAVEIPTAGNETEPPLALSPTWSVTSGAAESLAQKPFRPTDDRRRSMITTSSHRYHCQTKWV